MLRQSLKGLKPILMPHRSVMGALPPSCGYATGNKSSSSLGKKDARDVVLVDGCRIPFQMSSTGYKDLMAYELLTLSLRGLLRRNPEVNPAEIDSLVSGTVIQECLTSNIARESGLAAGIPLSVPAHTVTQACISSNQAISQGFAQIKAGLSDIVIASGTETMSDAPIRFSPALRKRMIAATKVRHPSGYFKLLTGLKLKDLAPQAPAIAEFSTQEVMGHSADRLATHFGVSRQEQDEYALRSHQMAAKAWKEGLFKNQIVDVNYPKSVTTDNGVRGDSTMEKLGKLKPAFIKPYGTITAANASYLTDGSSAVLLMSRERAKALGCTPLAKLHSFNFVAQDPKEELLLGPAYATARILKSNGIQAKNVDVFEFHEAFAGQILANLNALDSDEFAAKKIGIPEKVGRLPMDKFNNWGGSLSLGHPFGATGCRLVTTAARRLAHEDGQLALVAACAAGGQGTAMLVERES